jgi:DNA-binding CsgD family transcriptional regulator
MGVKFIGIPNSGKKYLCTEMAMKCLERLSFLPAMDAGVPVDLSIRELEILQLIAEGYTNAEMSDKLFISKRTVEGYRQNLIDKTNSKNTAALIRYAITNGIIN